MFKLFASSKRSAQRSERLASHSARQAVMNDTVRAIYRPQQII